MRMIPRLAVALALCTVVFGQERPKDVNGWDKIKWGMTIDEVRAAYGVTKPLEQNEYFDHLLLGDFEVSDLPLSASAGAKHGTGKVIFVRLDMLSNNPRFGIAFAKLRPLLIQKYGSPASEKPEMQFDKQVTCVLWVFPSTSIRLRAEPTSVSVEYEMLDRKNVDKL